MRKNILVTQTPPDEATSIQNRFSEFDKVTNQILQRLEQSERHATELEKALKDRDQDLSQRQQLSSGMSREIP